MKKVFLLAAFLTVLQVITAQSLDELVKRYTIANRFDRIAALKTIKISGNMTMMGAVVPMTIWMKNPNKIKIVSTFNGQEVIQVFDGVNGYMVNPMTGSATPVTMSPDQIKQTLRTSMFQNFLDLALKTGQLSLAGEETINNKPAYKLKVNIEGGSPVEFFLDKESSLLVKISAVVNEGGMTMTIVSYPTDYREMNGLIVPMKTTSLTQVMEFIMNFTKVEVDLPMDDNLFSVKQVPVRQQ